MESSLAFRFDIEILCHNSESRMVK